MHSSNILLLTGKSGSGKSQILSSVLLELEPTGLKTGGILAPGRYLKNGEKVFDLELLPGDEKYFLSTRNKQSDWKAIGSFWFNPIAVEAGLKHLSVLGHQNYDLCFVDEIGPFELDGELWSSAIPILLNTGIPMIWTLRPGILDQVCLKWGLINPTIVYLSEEISPNSKSIIRDWIWKNFPDHPRIS